MRATIILFLILVTSIVIAQNRAVDTSKNNKQIAKDLNNMAELEENQGHFESGIKYLFISLKKFEVAKDTFGMATVYLNIGNNYSKRVEYAKALPYFMTAIELAKKSTKDNNHLGINYLAIATALTGLERYEEAINYFHLSENRFKTSGNTYNLASLYSNLAYYYIEINNNNEGRKYIKQAMKLYYKAATPSDHVICLITLASTFFNEAEGLKNEKSKQKFDSCLFYLDSAQLISYKFNLKPLSMEIYKRKSEVYISIKDFERALSNMNNYITLHDSILSLEKEKQIAEINTKYEVEKKEQKNILLSEKNKVQSFTIFGLIAGFILFLVLLTLLFRQNKLRASQKSILLEQKLLRSQMNPHFIFNSLIAIESYIYDNDPATAGAYLSKFAQLMRQTLENSAEEYITLEKEILALQNYLTLQQLRFENTFNFTIHVDDAIDTSQIHIPPMLTQPFIENAIEHGFKKNHGTGQIQINFKLKDNCLLGEVIDNGIGIYQNQKPQEIKPIHKSMALSITTERLQLLNKGASKKISLNIQELNKEGAVTGTGVYFSIPLLR